MLIKKLSVKILRGFLLVALFGFLGSSLELIANSKVKTKIKTNSKSNIAKKQKEKSKPALSGRQIMEKNKSLPEAKDIKSQALMKIYKKGYLLEKEFETISKKVPEGDLVLLSFLRPTNIKLLTHSYKKKKNDQWLRLSSGKVKRINSSDKGRSFVNSHFSYEELEPFYLEDYQYKFLGEEKIFDFFCYKVKAVKKKDRVYDSLIYYLRKADFFIIRIDFYKQNKMVKYLLNQKIKKIDDIITPFEVVMQLAGSKDKTILSFKSIQYNNNLKNFKFSKAALR